MAYSAAVFSTRSAVLFLLALSVVPSTLAEAAVHLSFPIDDEMTGQPQRLGLHSVEVISSGPGADLNQRPIALQSVQGTCDQIQLSLPRVFAEPVVIDPSDINASTYRYYRSGSIAAVREISPGRYSTSTGRFLRLDVDVEPPECASLVEWNSSDGALEPHFGSSLELVFSKPGRRTFVVGPPLAQQSVQIEVYSVEITSHRTGADYIPEGVPVTLTAGTNPPGFEQDITWLASTSNGSSSPILGNGPTFTVVFDDTFGRGATPERLRQWLGVRADNATFGQDQKFDSTDQEPGVSYHDPDPLDPVHLFSGEFFLQSTDLRVRGRGLDFSWTRTYRSKLGRGTLQGHGWDFNYNLRVRELGDALLFHGGTGRLDLYQPAGRKWVRREFFQVFVRNDEGGYTLVFPDGSRWDFHPVDDRPEGGRISRMADRHGNALRFDYDALGRLAVIHDTLDTPDHRRDFTVSYNSESLIAAITDFTGRVVTYEYYDGTGSDGDSGDLELVTSPTVTGTPNGNDFPLGKTTRYTYTTSFPYYWLNHDLLTITDPKGQVFLQNVYAHTTDPADDRFTREPLHFNYDRLVSQIWGNPDDRIEIVYVPQVPRAENGLARVKVVVNDRMGNVHELLYDRANRLVLNRAFTARAEAGLPTTEKTNRPRFVLRSDDPPFFETRHEHNDDSLRTRTVFPNLNEVIFIYDTGNRRRGAQANLLRRCRLPGPLGGDQEEICEAFEYHPRFGTTGRSSFPIRHEDGRGNATLFEYNELGDVVRAVHRIPEITEEFEYNEFGQVTSQLPPENGSGYRRRDVFTYYAESDGHQNGYLREDILDADGRALTTTYEYDAVGNMVRQVDPRGNDSSLVYNQLDQVVRQVSRAVFEDLTIRYTTATFYDANDNVVRIDVGNFDDQGRGDPNTHFSTELEYEILNRVVRRSEEVDPDHEIATEYAYDRNRQLTLIRFGEATRGNQPDNMISMEYDALKRLFRRTQASGGPDAEITQLDYDGNGNLVRQIEGVSKDPRVTFHRFDGYNRDVEITDSMGNVSHLHYDSNGNPAQRSSEGELFEDRTGSVGNVRLAEETRVFDAMDRPIRQGIAHFDPISQAPIGDGETTTEIEYTPSSVASRILDDNGNATLFLYDTIYEVREVTDAAGNSVAFEYDENRNLLRVTETERSGLGGPEETYITLWEYDNENRPRRIVDPAGNVTQYGWDSRSNLIKITDANGTGTRRVFDGASRMTRTTTGSGATVGGPISIRQRWDDSSRLTEQVDGNGNRTEYSYDGRDRLTSLRYADGTSSHHTFNVHGNVTEITDANGTVTDLSYDEADRLLTRIIRRGASVVGTTSESFRYDGMGRVTEGLDDDSVVTFVYDSQDRVVEETLNGETTRTIYDGLGNPLSLQYPGGRTILRAFDALNRLQSISDSGATIATYSYAGPGRVERRDHGNGTAAAFRYDGIGNSPDDRGVRQVLQVSHLDPRGFLLDDRHLRWDAMGNKKRELDARTGRNRIYDHDRLYRLTSTTDVPASGVATTTAYVLDAAGNRTEVRGGLGAGFYVLDGGSPEPADGQANQYSATPFDVRTYDRNGNVVRIDPVTGGGSTKRLSYDYRDQLVRYVDSRVRVSFAYDVFGRMIAKEVTDTSLADTEVTRFLYDEWQAIEEQDALGTTEATYVYGPYLNEVVSMRRGGVDLFYHTDDLFNVLAVTDALGDVVERYDYGDFGEPSYLDPAGGPRAGSTIGNPWLLTGHRYLPEIGLYYAKTRFFDPRIGRFISRDSLGIWGDPSGHGNGFTYAGNNPRSWTDPTGQASIGFVGDSCDGLQQARLRRSLNDAEVLTTSASRYLQLLDPYTKYCDGRYWKWFGFPGSNFDEVRENFKLMANRFSSMITFDCDGVNASGDSLCEGITFAWTSITDSSSAIYLCDLFWYIPTLSASVLSAAPTIVHEVAHLAAAREDVGGGWGKGPQACIYFALFEPGKAVRNADNYRWFAEDPVPLSCNPLALFEHAILQLRRIGAEAVDIASAGGSLFYEVLKGGLGGAAQLGQTGLNKLGDGVKVVGSGAAKAGGWVKNGLSKAKFW